MKNPSSYLLKNLFILLLLFSCKRERSESVAPVSEMAGRANISAAVNRYTYTGMRPNGDQSFPNSGVRTTVFKKKLGGGADHKSVWIAVFFANGYWVQHGFGNNFSPFGVYKAGVGEVAGPNSNILPRTLITSGVVAADNQWHTYSIVNVPGTTLWRTYIDNFPIWEFDLGIDYANRPELFIEADAAKPPHWPMLDFNPAIEVLKNGQWVPISNGFVWAINTGMRGTLQDQKLIPNHIQMGGSIKQIPNGTQLF